MKRIQLVSVLTFLFAISAVQAQKQYLEESQAPSEILEYVKTYFPNEKIVSIKEEKKRSKVEYEVNLYNMTELEFDDDYKIKEIDSKTALPENTVPQAIRDYVAKNYPSSQIYEWKRKRKGQKIELDNDVELYFDFDGKFIRADD